MMRLIVLLSLATFSLLKAEEARITVDPSKVLAPVSPYLTGVCMEDVNHEIYGGIYSQLVFGESFQEPAATAGSGLSKWWKPVQSGSAQGKYELIHDAPFVGAQSQRITLANGEGKFGIANSGLNGQGIFRPYAGMFTSEMWVRAACRVPMSIGIADDQGRYYIFSELTVAAGDWHRVRCDIGNFSRIGPVGNHLHFEITLTKPGTIDLGYVFIRAEPSPIGGKFSASERPDVAEKMIELGTKVVRYGGSMINAPEYRWKKMTRPRAKRPPYKGTWYPYSSNGWGIPDFCAFTDAAGFLGIPAFNMGETPQDMADFLEYAHGAAATKWGAQRIADGIEKPFSVHIIELGNEEKVNEDYWKKFEPIARAIWSRDPKMILTVGDYHYDKVITDPFHVIGAEVDTLAAHRKILALAKEYGAEVWFDVHLNTEKVADVMTIDPLLSYIRALKRLSDGAKFHVVTYELNANTHDLNRALANAKMIGLIERAGAEPVVTSANALQVDGQNDNGWNQGLIFMNPEKVWVQPPGYVMQMLSRVRLKNVVQATCSDPNLDVTATASPDKIALQVVNAGATPVTAKLNVPGLTSAKVWTLAGDLGAVNTADKTDAVVPVESKWSSATQQSYTFPPHSFTVMRLLPQYVDDPVSN